MFTNTCYILRTLTNLHVGSGDTNYGIVDKEIQRDTASNLPIIHASSLKGALRDHLTRILKAESTQARDADMSCVSRFRLRVVFGADGNDTTQDDQEKRESCMKKNDKLPEQGMMRFYDARLAFVPMRSNVAPFFHVSSLETLKDTFEWLQALGIDDLPPLPANLAAETDSYVEYPQKAYVEDIECSPMPESLQKALKPLKEFFGIDRIALMSEKDFQTLIETLPVVARNKLDNGKSVNLWYEEVLPRQSLLVTAVSQYSLIDDSDRKDFEKAYEKLHAVLLNGPIQIGANASIGYGLCQFVAKGGKQ